ELKTKRRNPITAQQHPATTEIAHSTQPPLYQPGQLIQEFGELRLLPIALAHETRQQSCQLLKQILADTMILYSLYKKHHWQMRGPTFEQQVWGVAEHLVDAPLVRA